MNPINNLNAIVGQKSSPLLHSSPSLHHSIGVESLEVRKALYTAPGLRPHEADVFFNRLDQYGLLQPNGLLKATHVHWPNPLDSQIKKLNAFLDKKIDLCTNQGEVWLSMKIVDFLYRIYKVFNHCEGRQKIVSESLVGGSVREFLLDEEYIANCFISLGVPEEDVAALIPKNLIKNAHRKAVDIDFRFDCIWMTKDGQPPVDLWNSLNCLGKNIDYSLNHCTLVKPDPIILKDKVFIMRSFRSSLGEQVDFTAFFYCERLCQTPADGIVFQIFNPSVKMTKPCITNVPLEGTSPLDGLLHILGKRLYIIKPNQMDNRCWAKFLSLIAIGYLIFLVDEGSNHGNEILNALMPKMKNGSRDHYLINKRLKSAFEKHCANINVACVTALLAVLSYMRLGQKSDWTQTLRDYFKDIDGIEHFKGETPFPEIQHLRELLKVASIEELFALMQIAAFIGLYDLKSRVVWTSHLGKPALQCPLSNDPNEATLLLPLTLHIDFKQIHELVKVFDKRLKEESGLQSSIQGLLYSFAPGYLLFTKGQAFNTEQLLWDLHFYSKEYGGDRVEFKKITANTLIELSEEGGKNWSWLAQHYPYHFEAQLRNRAGELSDKYLLKLLQLCTQKEDVLRSLIGIWKILPVFVTKEFARQLCANKPVCAKKWLLQEGGSLDFDAEMRLELVSWLDQQGASVEQLVPWLSPLFENLKEGAEYIEKNKELFKKLNLLNQLKSGSLLHKAYVEARAYPYEMGDKEYPNGLKEALISYYPDKKSHLLYRQFVAASKRFEEIKCKKDIEMMLKIVHELRDLSLWKTILAAACGLKDASQSLFVLQAFCAYLPAQETIQSMDVLICALCLELGKEFYSLKEEEALILLPALKELTPRQQSDLFLSCPKHEVASHGALLESQIPFSSLEGAKRLYSTPFSKEQWKAWKILGSVLKEEHKIVVRWLATRDKLLLKEWNQLSERAIQNPRQFLGDLKPEEIEQWILEVNTAALHAQMTEEPHSELPAKLLSLLLNLSDSYERLNSEWWMQQLGKWKASSLVSHQTVINKYVQNCLGEGKKQAKLVNFCVDKGLFSVLRKFYEQLELENILGLSNRLHLDSRKEAQELMQLLMTQLFHDEKTVKQVLTILPPLPHKSLYNYWNKKLSIKKQIIFDLAQAKESLICNSSIEGGIKKRLLQRGKENPDKRALFQPLLEALFVKGVGSNMDALAHFALNLLLLCQVKDVVAWRQMRHWSAQAKDADLKKKVVEYSLPYPIDNDDDLQQQVVDWHHLLLHISKIELDEIAKDCIKGTSPLCVFFNKEDELNQTWAFMSIFAEIRSEQIALHPNVDELKDLEMFISKFVPDNTSGCDALRRKMLFCLLHFEHPTIFDRLLQGFKLQMQTSKKHELKDLEIFNNIVQRSAKEAPEKQEAIHRLFFDIQCLVNKTGASEAYIQLLLNLVVFCCDNLRSYSEEKKELYLKVQVQCTKKYVQALQHETSQEISCQVKKYADMFSWGMEALLPFFIMKDRASWIEIWGYLKKAGATNLINEKLKRDFDNRPLA